MSLRDQFVALKRKQTKAELPEINGEVYIREMSGDERDVYEAEQYKINGKSLEVNRKQARARLITKCLVDVEGNRVFHDDEVDIVGSIPASTLDKLFSVAVKLNGFSSNDLDDLAKN